MKFINFSACTVFMSPRMIIGVALLAALHISLSACSNALPRSERTMRSPWDSFEEAMTAYEKIIPYETTKEDLKALGYDPYSTPNVKILSYLDVIQRFMPNNSIKQEDLDPGVDFCLKARERCLAYEATPGNAKSKRVGNVMLDLMTFKRKTVDTGWFFNALIVMVDDVAVYKVWSGSPLISGEETRKNPLGPLQGAGDAALKASGI